ncbi:MAG: amidophosphoribosyltransferase [Candidatus Hadarchaeales archaeon]
MEVSGESCGVFGAFDFEGKGVFPYVYWGLISQNHRGHHSHGFAEFREGDFFTHRSLGLLPPVRHPVVRRLFRAFKSHVGMGHVRYATSGRSTRYWLLRDIQPFVMGGEERVALAFNGNLVNVKELRAELRGKTRGPSCSSSDIELLSRKLLKGLKNSDLVSAVEGCMRGIEGAFSVVGITQRGELFAFRDPLGIKPLCYGCSPDNQTFAVSSESVGLDINEFRYEAEVQPGELLIWSGQGARREKIVEGERRAFCSFEFAYFARPDSVLHDGRPVYKVREEFGRNLAREDPELERRVDAIVSIPSTGDDAAYGMHEVTGIPWERGVRRHRYVVDRAFISSSEEREKIISKKINVTESLKGKRIAVVEDSIVRGDTSRRVIRKLRMAGAAEVHMYFTFPRILSPCFYGIDMATFGELIGSTHREEEIARLIGADSVHYQSLEGFVRATGMKREELCLGCLTGKYPTPLAQKIADEMRERFERGEVEKGRVYEAE